MNTPERSSRPREKSLLKRNAPLALMLATAACASSTPDTTEATAASRERFTRVSSGLTLDQVIGAFWDNCNQVLEGELPLGQKRFSIQPGATVTFGGYTRLGDLQKTPSMEVMFGTELRDRLTRASTQFCACGESRVRGEGHTCVVRHEGTGKQIGVDVTRRGGDFMVRAEMHTGGREPFVMQAINDGDEASLEVTEGAGVSNIYPLDPAYVEEARHNFVAAVKARAAIETSRGEPPSE